MLASTVRSQHDLDFCGSAFPAGFFDADGFLTASAVAPVFSSFAGSVPSPSEDTASGSDELQPVRSVTEKATRAAAPRAALCT